MSGGKTDIQTKKIILAAVNASFVHSNPAVYALRRSTLRAMEGMNTVRIEIAEYTINDRYEDILFDLIGREADVIGISVYIWNARICRQLLADLRRLYPAGGKILFAGGPEASTRPEEYLESCDFVLRGEGEESFAQFCMQFEASDPQPVEGAGCVNAETPDPLTREGEESVNAEAPDEENEAGNAGRCAAPWKNLPGAVYRENGVLSGVPEKCGFSAIGTMPFLYDGTEDFEHRIIYYETSRGCPFRCTYCLSSEDAPLRFRDMGAVREELQYFLDRKVSLVKFVDRTFNANAARAREIWEFIRDHDNGVTGFHFEIGADLLSGEDIAFLKMLRPGLIQLEIGIQSVNPVTLRAIRRVADNRKIFRAVCELAAAQNIALHTDLIAGLPYEDFESFGESFNSVYRLRAHQFQLGFLKVLAGTEMARRAGEYGIISSASPPYTVLSTNWLAPSEIDELRGIADMVEMFWNSGLFRHALPYLEQLFGSPFAMYRNLFAFYRKTQGRKALSPRARGEFLASFAAEESGEEDAKRNNGQFCLHKFEELLRFDGLLHFHSSRRMSAEADFDAELPGLHPDEAALGELKSEVPPGSVTLEFDYRNIHPVTKEAAFRIKGERAGK